MSEKKHGWEAYGGFYETEIGACACGDGPFTQSEYQAHLALVSAQEVKPDPVKQTTMIPTDLPNGPCIAFTDDYDADGQTHDWVPRDKPEAQPTDTLEQECFRVCESITKEIGEHLPDSSIAGAFAAFIRTKLAERDAQAQAQVAAALEEAAKLLQGIVEEHRENVNPMKHEFCDQYGCFDLLEFARRIRALISPSARAALGGTLMNDNQIKHMVNRFLTWRLPENFNPDAGISFKPHFNEHTAHPMKHEPVGTNLFDATQAEAMIRYLVDELPQPAHAALGTLKPKCPCCGFPACGHPGHPNHSEIGTCSCDKPGHLGPHRKVLYCEDWKPAAASVQSTAAQLPKETK